MNIRIVLIAFILGSCFQGDPNKEIDEGRISGDFYESKEIGWSIIIPKTFTIISKDKNQENDKKGKAAIEKSMGQSYDISGLKHLITFQKDRTNVFGATSEPFIESHPGEYDENTRAIYEMLYKTFTDQGMMIDTSSGKEIIQGLEFNTFFITIMSPQGNTVLHQIVYSKLIKGLDFGVSITYSDEKAGTEMLHAWKNSKFYNY